MANQSGDEKESASPSESLSENTGAAAAEVRQSVEGLRDTVAATGERLEEEAEADLSEGAASLDEMLTKAEFAVIDHPLAAVGIAFAAGWLTSRLFR